MSRESFVLWFLLRAVLHGMWDAVRPVAEPSVRDQGDRLSEQFAAWCRRCDDVYLKVERVGLAFHAMSGVDPLEARRRFLREVRMSGISEPLAMARWMGQAADAREWVASQVDADGDWADGFLDTLAAEVAKEGPT